MSQGHNSEAFENGRWLAEAQARVAIPALEDPVVVGEASW